MGTPIAVSSGDRRVRGAPKAKLLRSLYMYNFVSAETLKS